MIDKKIPSIKELKKYKLKDLKQLSKDIREVLQDLSNNKSIHFSSNLGIVELSIALLYVFDSPIDQIMYDTGHQSYVHKILTDRYNRISTIRDFNGLSGFQEPSESQHDFISTGHSGNILSITQGLNETKNNDNYFIPIVGDASISNGLSFEALNNISFNSTKMLIVINDNEMSISKNVGTLHKMMSKIKTSNINFFGGNLFRQILGKKNWTRKIYFFFSSIASWFEQLFTKNNFFISMNYKYIGPVDGHNIKKLIYSLKKAKFHCDNKPVVLHVRTKKGYGCNLAELDKLGKYHASSIKTLSTNSNLSFGDVAANYLFNLLKSDNNIYVLNPAMTYSTGFLEFAKIYPNNYEDIGIAEEHCVSKAVGICKNNKKVFVIIYSTFLQRTYDQLHHDVSRLDLPIIFLIDRADIAYGDGDTHHGIYDLSFLKTIPNSIITAPRNKYEMEKLMELSYLNKKHPFFIRYPKTDCINDDKNVSFNFGDWIYLQKKSKSKNLIISYGPIINDLLNHFSNKNIDIVNSIFLTKYNENKVVSILKQYKTIYVVEKVYYQNNLFTDLVLIKNRYDINITIKSICIKNNKIGHGDKESIDKTIKMDLNSIIKEIKF